ncbi:hypothetical protein [Microvirga rosea]|uniref:hypothetical protein n=1 Tax=Microvirga rosea TaxID=2715425 RepID=UPI001D0B7333|nr:hypothetical protein [Microvirga rosea]MCB8819791.1 hypothetical protein [Microvirga rosea]
MSSEHPKIRRGVAGKDVLENFETLLSRHKSSASPESPESKDEPDPQAVLVRDIAAKLQAAVLDATATEALDEKGIDEEPTEELAIPELFDEEFQARVIGVVRQGLVKEAEATGAEVDRRQLACFEEAVTEGTIIVRRAEQVDGLSYRATRSMLYGADGRIVDDGSSESWDDEFVYSRMADSQSVIIGTAEAIGGFQESHYYVSFPNPDVLLTFDQQLYRLARQKAEEP